MSYSAGKSRESRESCDGQPLDCDWLAYLAPVLPASYSNPKWNLQVAKASQVEGKTWLRKLDHLTEKKISTELKTNTAWFQKENVASGSWQACEMRRLQFQTENSRLFFFDLYTLSYNSRFTPITRRMISGCICIQPAFSLSETYSQVTQ